MWDPGLSKFGLSKFGLSKFGLSRPGPTAPETNDTGAAKAALIASLRTAENRHREILCRHPLKRPNYARPEIN